MHGNTIELEHKILAKNDLIAAQNRGWLKGRNILALNLVSSPGAGKTTLLTHTITDLQHRIPITVIEGDQETANDAQRIQATGCPVVQVNTGTGCHLEAAMIERGLQTLNPPMNFSPDDRECRESGVSGSERILAQPDCGCLYVIAGIYILSNLLISVAALTFALGILFIAEGIYTIIMGFTNRAGHRMSWLVVLNGVITLILGILVLNQFPFSAIWLIGLYVGISLLFSEVSLLVAALAVRKTVTTTT
ncbi:GTP-binding protein [Leptodesmis sp.]|uniref:GTP-binding protein n=1 Tax=Leptodesmis sp. TaxID=3100501 RepID=UPI00405346F3